MEFVKAIILGVIQGITEFLPISSSGHLVIGSELLDFQGQGITFDVFVHLGTLLAVIVFFRNEMKEMVFAPFRFLTGERSRDVLHFFRMDMYVIIATLPAVFVGLFLKDFIEAIFSSLFVVFTMLAVTGCIMILSRFLPDRNKEPAPLSALLIGCAQACAIFPGLSRSASTIFTGMLLGIDRETAARFSFIMSVPAILGAVVLQLGNVLQAESGNFSVLQVAAGTIAAAISGYFAIALLLDVVKKNRLQWFGYYCILISFIGFIFLL